MSEGKGGEKSRGGRAVKGSSRSGERKEVSVRVCLCVCARMCVKRVRRGGCRDTGGCL